MNVLYQDLYLLESISQRIRTLGVPAFSSVHARIERLALRRIQSVL